MLAAQGTNPPLTTYAARKGSRGAPNPSAAATSPLHESVVSFFGGLKQIAAQFESEARELRASVEKPPLSGSQGYSSLFMKKMRSDTSRLQKDVAAMHTRFTEAVSFEEIIRCCMDLYQQNEVWREELEDILEQEHGIQRVEQPPLLSPAHSHDEKEDEEEEEEAVEPEDKGMVLPVRNMVQPSPRLPLCERPQSAAHNVNKVQQSQDKPAAMKSVNHLLSASPCADDIGLSASSRAILANRTPPAMKPTLHMLNFSQLSGPPPSIALSSYGSSVEPSSSTRGNIEPYGSNGLTPSSTRYQSGTSMNYATHAPTATPQTPSSTYRPSYATIAASPPRQSSSVLRGTASSSAVRPNPRTPSTATRGAASPAYSYRRNVSSNARAPITPLRSTPRRQFDHMDDGTTECFDLGSLSPIRPSGDGKLYPSLPATTPTVDLRYKHLIGNSPQQPWSAIKAPSFAGASSFASASLPSTLSDLDAKPKLVPDTSFLQPLPSLTSSSTSTSQLIATISEAEYEHCPSFLRAQLSLSQLNEVIQKVGHYCTLHGLTHFSEDQLRNELGLGTKCKAVILYLLQLKRIAANYQDGATVYVLK